jgi:anti-sigma-K factor RskA
VQHCDPEALSLLALGESAGAPEDERHLIACARCQSELDQLRAVVSTARSVSPMDTPTTPRREVWDSIASELALDDRSVPGGAAAAEVDEAVVVPMRRRRTAPWLMAAAAAIVGVLAGAAVVNAIDRPAESTVVASAVLEPLNVPDATGTAELTSAGSDRALVVDVTGLPTTDGFYEVWLLDATADKLISLGTLGAGDTGTFPVPTDLDVAEFPVVDVSREPFDGNPAHSADSVVRGTLSV